jgi:hypothetical protein
MSIPFSVAWEGSKSDNLIKTQISLEFTSDKFSVDYGEIIQDI